MTCPLCHEPTRVGGLPCPDCLRRDVIGRPPFVWEGERLRDLITRLSDGTREPPYRSLNLHGVAPDSGLLEDR